MLRTLGVLVVFGCSSIYVSAVPKCIGECNSGDQGDYMCTSECYTSNENLLCSCEDLPFVDEKAVCKDKDDEECAIVPEPNDAVENEAGCRAACAAADDCGAYIFDQIIDANRCRLIKLCQTQQEAAVPTPCTDCLSGRNCHTCPTLTYTAGATNIHWICDSSGDAYNNKAVEGTKCTPTHQCKDEAIPAEIECKSPEEGSDEGKWFDGDNPFDEKTCDTKCPCNEITIPKSEDTNLFCDSVEQPVDDGNGNWKIDGSTTCDVVCDGQIFIPISCKFNEDGTQTAWHITYGGQDITLDDQTTCFSCSGSNCEEDPNTTAATTKAPTTATPTTATPTTPAPTTAAPTTAPEDNP